MHFLLHLPSPPPCNAPIARAQSNQCKELNATSVFRMRKRHHWSRRGLASQSVRPELKELTLGRFTSWRDYYRVTGYPEVTPQNRLSTTLARSRLGGKFELAQRDSKLSVAIV